MAAADGDPVGAAVGWGRWAVHLYSNRSAWTGSSRAAWRDG